MKNYYVFGSRILTHTLFWIGYYLLFGFIWGKEKGYLDSYYLEFLLLPIRMAGAYLMIYVVLPKTLLIKKYVYFLLSYGALLASCALVQRVFIYFFYESHEVVILSHLFAPNEILRAIILINSTVLLLAGFKILQLYYIEREKNQLATGGLIELKSDKRIHRINPEMILYLKGMGNYVTYYLTNSEQIITYSSMKDALSILPNNFQRIHKSYIVNENYVSSYNKENVIVNNKTIPIGKSMSFQ